MNENIKLIIKTIVAVLGGINTMFSILIPMFLVLMLVSFYSNLNELNQQLLLWIGYLSTLYRGISFIAIKK